MIVPGGPSHWSFGGGMLWLTGHWEWHALASYVRGAARRRADHDLFDGRHACRSGAPAGRGRRQGRAPQPQRALRRHHGRAHPRAEARARPHRLDGDRSAPRRLHAGQPVQRAARESARRRAGLHQGLPARTCCRSTAPKSSTACARPACCARTPWTPWSRAPSRA